MISVLSDQDSPRLRFVLGQIFTQWLGVEWKLVFPPEEPEKDTTFTINYSHAARPADMQILPEGLLCETGIRKGDPPYKMLAGIPVFFPDEGADPGFDFFSAVFWMITRMEEYQHTSAEKHGRYTAADAFCGRNNWLEIPLVDAWLEQFTRCMRAKNHPVSVADAFRFECTIDVDNAYAMRGKPFWRQVLASARDLLRGNFALLSDRWKIRSGKLPDPNDTYAYLEAKGREHRVSFTFFYLLGNYGKYDRNLSWYSPVLKEIILSNAAWSRVGVHPSYPTCNRPDLVKRDVERLKEITGMRINLSRQHFLRFSLPLTFRALSAAGIRHEYSMGFHDAPGFRAGTGRAFYFYDLEAELQTELEIHPFVYMDGTFHDYMKIGPDEAMQRIHALTETCRSYGTTLVVLWHNDSVNDTGAWKGWRKVFENQLALAAK